MLPPASNITVILRQVLSRVTTAKGVQDYITLGLANYIQCIKKRRKVLVIVCYIPHINHSSHGSNLYVDQ